MLPETKYRLDTLSEGSTGFNEPEGPSCSVPSIARELHSKGLRFH